MFTDIYDDMRLLRPDVEDVKVARVDLVKLISAFTKDPSPELNSLLRINMLLERIGAETDKIYRSMKKTSSRFVKFYTNKKDCSIDLGPICQETKKSFDKLRVFHDRFQKYSNDIGASEVLKISGEVVKSYNSFLRDVVKCHKIVEPGIQEKDIYSILGENLTFSENRERQI